MIRYPVECLTLRNVVDIHKLVYVELAYSPVVEALYSLILKRVAMTQLVVLLMLSNVLV